MSVSPEKTSVEGQRRKQPADRRKNIALRVAAPDLTEIVPGITRQPTGQPQAEQPAGGGSRRRPGAAVVVPFPVGRPKSPSPDAVSAAADTQDVRPANPPISPQAAGRCRDIDPQLARIIDLWPGLPRSVRAAMLAMT